MPRLDRGVSGRAFVLGAVIGLLLVWGVLFLIFSNWRSRVEERIAFGKDHVATVVREMEHIEPPGVDGDDWRGAIAETEAMLAEVVGTGRMDRLTLDRMRSALIDRVAEARREPETAPEVLARIWDEMARLKHFRFGTERPELIRPAREAPEDRRESRRPR